MNTHPGQDRAACAQLAPREADQKFFEGSAGDQMRTVWVWCRPCPARIGCLTLALDQRMEYGVAGATTSTERARLHKALPDITRWGPLLARAGEWEWALPSLMESTHILEPLQAWHQAQQDEKTLTPHVPDLVKEAREQWEDLALLTRLWLLASCPQQTSPPAPCTSTEVVDAGAPT